ncbi:MAG: peptidase M20 [Caulobacterales bacterium 32-69-10]|nr:MAG: peptidase M20 [Caulobacterales bacterium 32-69-10]
MRHLSAALALTFLAAAPANAQTPGEAAFRAMFKEMVETDTSAATGNCTTLVEKVSARMAAAGFPQTGLHLFIPPSDPKAGALVAVYPGTDPQAKAVLMLGHIDVVNARREDWTRDPFVLVEENGEFYGRGVSDMKAQDAIWADTLVRFHQEGYRPRRTVKMALTCGEEGGGFLNGAGWLAQNQRDLIDAGLALTEGGGGELDESGKKLAVTVMAAEKDIAAFVLEVTNRGGHSSRPRPDNAIYTLARALDRLSRLEFPATFNAANRPYFTGMSQVVGGADAEAMKTLLARPDDKGALAVLNRSVAYHAMLGTTCIPVLLDAGHAGNAQPQRARATINCRMLPGEPVGGVKAAIAGAVADPKVTVIGGDRPATKPLAPPLTPAFLDPITTVAAEVYPGLPVLPMQETFGTDSGRLIAVGIPTYGVSGLFRGPDQGNIHGLNEHIGVRSVMEGREFLYRLIKAYAEQE